METRSTFEPTVMGSIWSKRWWALSIFLLVTLVAIGASYLMPSDYQASATLVVEDPRASAVFEFGNVQNPQRYVADQAAILQSTAVALKAIESEGSLEALDELDESLEVRWTQDSNVIEVLFKTDSRESARTGANAVALAYSDLKAETVSSSYDAALSQLEDSIADVESRLFDLQDEIESAINQDPSSSVLREQMSEALVRLTTLQSELPEASGERLESLRSELDDISQQIQITQAVLQLESQSPGVALLLEEQGETVARKLDLLQRLNELDVQSELESTGIVLYSPALNAEEVGLDIRRSLAIGLVAAIVVASGVAYTLALRDRTIEDRAQPELLLQTPLISTIPDFNQEKIQDDLPVQSSPSSMTAESFRFVAAAVDLERTPHVGTTGKGSHVSMDGDLGTSLIVVSPMTGDGKTVVVANMATVLAQQGKKVLAIDADFTRQDLTRLVVGERASGNGMTDLAYDRLSLDEVIQVIELGPSEQLHLLSQGLTDVHAPDFFRSSRARSLFEEVRKEYDVIIIDSPPMLSVAYSSLLVRYADSAIAVVAHASPVSAVSNLADRLDFLHSHAIGYVYNKAPIRAEQAYAAIS